MLCAGLHRNLSSNYSLTSIKYIFNANCKVKSKNTLLIDMPKTKISVIGAGYVGLCTAVGFASKGFKVVCSDIDADKVTMIKEGIPPFHEPGLPEMLNQSIKNGTLKCLVNQTKAAVLESDITYIAVGTPSKPDGSIDLRYIESSAKDIGQALKQKNTYHVIVVKSTVFQAQPKTLSSSSSRKSHKRKQP